MVQQVRLVESYVDASMTALKRRVFAFGTHEEATVDDQHAVTTADPVNNPIRVIMDELLVGNNLEEIQCRGIVDDDAYDRVPLGATPDDVARCSVPRDVLPSSCVGGNTICICHNDAGCLVNNISIAKGEPVGITDIDQDGAADDTRFIRGAVGLLCDGADIALNLETSYWTPSGNQRVPAQGGFEVLGPAVLLNALNPLPTNKTCKLTFSPDVVDKEGNAACAPPNGDITQDCTAGDFNAFSFKVEPLVLDGSVMEGSTGVGRLDDITFRANTTLAATAPALVTITQAGTPFTAFTATLTNMGRSLVITPTGTGFAANTTYVLTIPVTVTDAQGSPLPAPIVITFTTGAL